MKRKLRKSLDAVLDGLLGKRESDLLLQDLHRDPQARAVLALEQRIHQALATLPAQQLARDLKLGVLRAIEASAGPAGVDFPRPAPRPAGREPLFRPLWATPVMWAGIALAAGSVIVTVATIPLRRSAPRTEAPAGVQTTQAPRPVPALVPCRILRVEGEVQGKTTQGTTALRAGDTLARGDVLWTGEGGEATVEIGSTARLLIHETSEIQIRGLSAEAPTLELLTGRVTVQRTTQSPSALRLQAEELALEAGGNAEEWMALRPAPDRVVFGVRQGAIQLTVSGQTLTLQEGFQLKFWKDHPAPQTTPLPEDPELALTPAAKELRAGAKPLRIEGKTDSHARLWLQKKLVAVDGLGRFELSVDARPGDTLTIEAENLLGHRTRRTLGPLLPPRKPSAKTPQKDDIKKYKIEW